MDGWMDEWMDGWLGGWQSECTEILRTYTFLSTVLRSGCNHRKRRR